MTGKVEEHPKNAALPEAEHVQRQQPPLLPKEGQTLGHTFADVLHNATSSWTAMGKLVLIVWVPIVVVVILVFGAFFKYSPTIEFRPGLITVSPRRAVYHYYLLHPRGWQNTGIKVREGQRLSITASGSVHIDLPGLVEHVLARSQLEQRGGDDQLIEAQLANIKPLRWQWLDPGERDPILDPARADRRALALDSSTSYGTLLGGIHGRENIVFGRQPDSRFVIGRQAEVVVSRDGFLYLAINDVYQKQFHDDNIGFYSVLIKVN